MNLIKPSASPSESPARPSETIATSPETSTLAHRIRPRTLVRPRRGHPRPARLLARPRRGRAPDLRDRSRVVGRAHRRPPRPLARCPRRKPKTSPNSRERSTRPCAARLRDFAQQRRHSEEAASAAISSRPTTRDRGLTCEVVHLAIQRQRRQAAPPPRRPVTPASAFSPPRSGRRVSHSAAAGPVHGIRDRRPPQVPRLKGELTWTR